jgi:VanZ family protein
MADIAMLTGIRIERYRVSLVLGGVLLLVAAITTLAPGYSPPSQYNADKFIHAGFYCLLTLFWLYAIGNGSLAKRLAIAAAVFAYGALLELLQHYIDGRMGSIADVGANGLGILMALSINAALSAHVFNTHARNRAG